MEKSIVRLMKLTPVTHNCTFWSNYEHTIHKFWQKSTCLYHDHVPLKKVQAVNHVTKPTVHKANSDDNDMLSYKPLHYNDTDKTSVEETTASHLNSFIKILSIKTDHERQAIRESRKFVALCSDIKRDIRYLNVDQVLTSLKIMSTLKVQSNTTIVQMLLQYIRASINQLSLDQILYTWHLLRMYEETPLSAALQNALCVVYKNEIVTLDTTNITQMKMALHFACAFMDENSIRKIIRALLQYSDKYTLKHAIDICRSLSLIKHPVTASMAFLLNKLYKTIIYSAENIKYSDARMLLRVMCRGVQQQMTYFYNDTLVDIVVLEALKSNPSLLQVTEILGYLNEMCHSNKFLLDYIVTKCSSDMLTFQMCPFSHKLGIIRGFNISDYKPDIWPAIKENLAMENLAVLDDSTLLSLAVNLAVLDHYDPNILERIFRINITSLPQATQYGCAFKLLIMHQNVKMFCPAYTGPFLSNEVLNEISSMVIEWDKNKYPARMLEFILGGSKYVKKNVRTRLGHLIDQVIVIQPNSQPVNMDTLIDKKHQTAFAEDIKPPNGSKAILIFNMPEYAYTSNTKCLLRVWMSILKTAEALTGFRATALNISRWQHLNEHAKVTYLENIIKEQL